MGSVGHLLLEKEPLTMKAYPLMSAEAAGVGLLWKALASLGAGVLGAAIMAAVDPPTTRKELFSQAAVAGVGSLVFGPVVLRVVNHFVPFLGTDNKTVWDLFEVAVPVYFLVGAISWGFFGAVAKVRKMIADKAASALAKKLGVEQ